MAKNKSRIGEIFNGKWKYIGKGTFENIYNKKTFTTNKSNASHVFTGRTTIDKLITYELNGKSYTPTKRRIMYYASSLRRAIKWKIEITKNIFKAS